MRISGATKLQYIYQRSPRRFHEMAVSRPSVNGSPSQSNHETRIFPIAISKLGTFNFSDPGRRFLAPWDITLDTSTPNQDAYHLLSAADAIRETDTPVAFPTETVYGLGASAVASRSEAVKNIFRAKGRPADNPLIVHVSSLEQLATLLRPVSQEEEVNGDPWQHIPSIYHPLIHRFWPGPLTILLPLPSPSPLAPEVTGNNPNLCTFGARMPSSLLALALIHLADTPLAAPSANASTRPSPTMAQHVFHDLQGKINIILDGGPCDVGVESTVVDGLSNPPAILRPGGITLEALRSCEGWEGVVKGYRDHSTSDKKTSGVGDGQGVNGEESRQEEAPRAPGMKYKHYSPRARLILINGSLSNPSLLQSVVNALPPICSRIGFITTKHWTNQDVEKLRPKSPAANENYEEHIVRLGGELAGIAKGLFAALRELDEKGVEVILVEGLDDDDEREGAAGGEAAAVMNRLRKAAEVQLR